MNVCVSSQKQYFTLQMVQKFQNTSDAKAIGNIDLQIFINHAS